jgi:DNA repair protein RadC
MMLGGMQQHSRNVAVLQDGEPIRLWLESPPDDPPPDPARVTTCDDGSATVLQALLGCVLGSAAPVTGALIAGFGSVGAVLAARRSQLIEVPGMTEAAVRLLEAARTTCRWAAEEEIRGRPLIGGSSALERYLRATLRGQRVETVRGLFLDRKSRLIQDRLLGAGTVDHAPLYPREVVRHAIELDASALILVHNHPSGDPEPSPADIDTTRRIARALATIDVALHDHVIVGDNQILSLRARRLL